MGLAYRDSKDSDLVLMVVRDGKFIPPVDGWVKEGRVYVPQEPMTPSKAKGKPAGCQTVCIRQIVLNVFLRVRCVHCKFAYIWLTTCKVLA